MVPIATPVSSTVGKETMDGCHVTEVTPPIPPLTFYVVVRAPPTLTPFAPEILPGSQFSTPLALDVAETGSCAGINPRPHGLEVSVAPPRAPFLAIEKTDCSKKLKHKKMEAKLKKQKDRE